MQGRWQVAPCRSVFAASCSVRVRRYIWPELVNFPPVAPSGRPPQSAARGGPSTPAGELPWAVARGYGGNAKGFAGEARGKMAKGIGLYILVSLSLRELDRSQSASAGQLSDVMTHTFRGAWKQE